MKILFLLPQFPYPPINGIRWKPYTLLRAISHQAQCDLFWFGEMPSKADVDGLREQCPGVNFLGAFAPRRSSLFRKLNGFLAEGLPSAAVYQNPEFEHAVRKALSESSYDAVHIDMISLAWLASKIDHPHILLSVNDAVSLGYLKAAKSSTSALQTVWLTLMAATFRRYESKAYRNRVVHVVSHVDREYLCGVCPSARVEVVELAVEPSYFQAGHCSHGRSNLVTIPACMYSPGVSRAILQFLAELFPRRGTGGTAVSVHIVGRGADASFLRGISQYKNARYIPWVDDYREMLRRSAVCIFPEGGGAGTKNRLLQAMATGVPVVVSHGAAAGVTACDSVHFLVRETPAEFALSVKRILSDPDLASNLGREARRYALENHSLESVAEKWERLYGSLSPQAASGVDVHSDLDQTSCVAI